MDLELIIKLKTESDKLDEEILLHLEDVQKELKRLSIGLPFHIVLYDNATLHYKKENNTWGLYLSFDEGNIFIPIVNVSKANRMLAAIAIPKLLQQIQSTLESRIAEQTTALKIITSTLQQLEISISTIQNMGLSE